MGEGQGHIADGGIYAEGTGRMTGITIKRHSDGAVLYEAPDATNMKDAVEAAVRAGANLDGASLEGMVLDHAWLVGASLNNAWLVDASLNNASLNNASLNNARLDGARLDHAKLVGAKLNNARLDHAEFDSETRLPTGETWEEYLRETLPALLVSGGRALSEVATAEHWDCHDWDNCPMHAAFGAGDISDVPILLRPRAEQFIQLFDAGLIPLEDVQPK